MDKETNEFNSGYVDSEYLPGFLEKNRKSILIAIIGIAGLCVAFVATMIILDMINNKSIADFEPLNERYEKILQSKEYEALTDPEFISDDADKAAEAGSEQGESIEAFLTDIRKYAESHSGYPAAEAWSLIAHLEAKQKKWELAEEDYIKSAETGSKTHLAPVSLFNAAVVSEELGNSGKAIEYYVSAIKYPDFSQAAHAQFSIGRIYEENSNRTAAAEAYQAVIDKWPKSENWVSLARRQLISLDTEK